MNNSKENDSVSKLSFKNKNIKLIKVPKFVSNKWLQYNNKDIVGLLGFNNNNNNDSEITELYVQKDDSDNVKKLRCNKNNTVNTYILKQNVIKLKSTNKSVSNSAGTLNNKSNDYTNTNKGKNTMNNLSKDNSDKHKEFDYVVCADLIKTCDYTYSFLPTLDQDYSSILKERHYKTNVKKERFTIIETRNEENMDATHTLFKYYTSEDKLNNESKDKNMKNNKRLFTDNDNLNTVSHSTSKQKAKQSKKMHVFDLDKAKISMFKIFEREGQNGVPFSFFTKSFNIPANHIKGILDEIAIKGKRDTDKKTVYFLKNCIG